MTRICLFATYGWYAYCNWKYEVPMESLPDSVQWMLVFSISILALVLVHDCYLIARDSK
jgi:hypothetical protein